MLNQSFGSLLAVVLILVLSASLTQAFSYNHATVTVFGLEPKSTLSDLQAAWGPLEDFDWFCFGMSCTLEGKHIDYNFEDGGSTFRTPSIWLDGKRVDFHKRTEEMIGTLGRYREIHRKANTFYLFKYRNAMVLYTANRSEGRFFVAAADYDLFRNEEPEPKPATSKAASP